MEGLRGPDSRFPRPEERQNQLPLFKGMMAVRVRKQLCLMLLSLTGVLLLLVLSSKPLQPTKPATGESEVGFLRRRMANDESSVAPAKVPTDDGPRQENPPASSSSSAQDTAVRGSSEPTQTRAPPPPPPRPPPIHLTEGERKSLAKQGILLVEDEGIDGGEVTTKKVPPARPRLHEEPPEEGADGRAPQQKAAGQGIQHAQWLRQVEEQHKDFLRQQHSLQNQHLLQARLLQQKLQQEEQKKKQQQQSNGASLASKLSQVRQDLTGIAVDPFGYKGRAGPAMMSPVSYESLKKQGEIILHHTLKREFLNAPKDTTFSPGEAVDPSQVRRVIIVSTWRSGSTFLGDLVRSYPGTFFSFEPLHHLLKNQHLQEGPLVEKVISLLRGILTCDYSQLDDYVNYMRNNTFLIDHNIRLWNSCMRNRALCFDKEYLSNICKYMPVNVLKTVRMGLLPVVDLLQDPGLNLRVIHLVRDPRGCLHSRMQLSWCHSQACSDPETVCKDLLTDLTLSDWMKQSFPDRYLLVRYEDMGLQPEEKAREIFKFLQLTYNRYVATFVKEHTTPSRKTKRKYNTYSTFRDSKVTTFAWRGALNYTTVEAIQDVCVEPLQRLKLRIFQNEEEYQNITIPVLLSA